MNWYIDRLNNTQIFLFILITFPKLPLPNTVKKWKSSTEYFLKRGIEVAGAVIVPDRWNCAYVYDVSIERIQDANDSYQ